MIFASVNGLPINPPYALHAEPSWYDFHGRAYWRSRSGEVFLSVLSNPMGSRQGFLSDAPEHLKLVHDLYQHPRPLDDDERRILREAARPVLSDLAVVGLSPDIRDESREDLGAQAVTAWLQGPIRGIGQVLRVWRDASFAGRVVQLAEQLQEWASDSQTWEHAGYSRAEVELWAIWPVCPEHDGSHALVATLGDDCAVWSCAESGHVIAKIGALDQANTL
jgi:hypothetical protein